MCGYADVQIFRLIVSHYYLGNLSLLYLTLTQSFAHTHICISAHHKECPLFSSLSTE